MAVCLYGAGGGGGWLGEGTVLLPGFWRFAQHSPHFQSLHLPPVCDWCPSSCCPGVCIVLNLCRPLKLQNPAVSSTASTPTGFIARGYGDLFSQLWNPGLCSLVGAGIVRSQGILPDFYLPHVNVGPSQSAAIASASLPHLHSSDLPTHLVDVASLNPWLLDFHTA